MLVAMSEGGRVDAATASKGARFDCPHCHGGVILKRGRFVIGGPSGAVREAEGHWRVSSWGSSWVTLPT